MAEAQDLVDLPEQALADRLVPDHGALGTPGRARGEDDVGQGVAGDGDSGVLGGTVAEPPVAEVDGHGFRFARGGLARGVELHDDPGVLDDDGPALGGPVRVERDERAARPEDGEQSDHHLGGAFQGDADDVFDGEPSREQLVGQLGRQLLHLTVSQSTALVDDGHGVRPGARLFAEHLHQAGTGPVGVGVVPPGEELQPLRRATGADGAERAVREVGQVVERELRLVGHDAARDGDGPRVGAPTGGRGTAAVGPAEHVGEQGARGEVESGGAAPLGPVRQCDGARLGDDLVGEVAGAAAQAGQLRGRKPYERSGRFHHRRLNAPSKE